MNHRMLQSLYIVYQVWKTLCSDNPMKVCVNSTPNKMKNRIDIQKLILACMRYAMARIRLVV